MRSCQSCGNLNEDQAIFCDMCGLRLSRRQSCEGCGIALTDGGQWCSGCRPALSVQAMAGLGEARRATAPLTDMPEAWLAWAQAGIHIPLPARESFTIGRAGSADVELDRYDEGTVSRQHARISYRDGQFLLEDLGSTNGTCIGRERLTEVAVRQPVNLRDGDLIAFGDLLLCFGHRHH